MIEINFNNVSSKEISKEKFSNMLNECGVGFYGFENIYSNDIEKFESYFTNASFSVKGKKITLNNLYYEWEN